MVKNICVFIILLGLYATAFGQSGADTSEPEKKSVSQKAETSEKGKQDKQKEDEGKKAARIKETIKFGTQTERREAVNMINRIKDDSYRQELYDLLVETLKTETNSDACVKILTVMGDMKIKRGETEVAEKLNHESDDVVIAAVLALKSLEAVSQKDKLIEKLKAQKMDEDSRLTQSLLSALGEFKSAELLPFATEQLEGTTATSSVREQFTLFAGNIDTAESKALLLKLYKDEDEEMMIRCFAVNGLAKLKAVESTADINGVLKWIDAQPFKKKQQYYNLEIYSVAALVKLGDDNAVPRLIDSLKSDNASVRLRAVELIKETGDKRTIDILKYKTKYDPDAKVRKAAKDALESMGVETEAKSENKSEAKDDIKGEITSDADKNKIIDAGNTKESNTIKE